MLVSSWLFTIYQKPQARHFIDLYLILKKTGWKIPDIKKKAQVKFDHFVDPLQLGAQFLKSSEVEDFPRMIVKLSPDIWRKFFMQEAKKMGNQILGN
mgnify:CR=1 FL=1